MPVHEFPIKTNENRMLLDVLDNIRHTLLLQENKRLLRIQEVEVGSQSARPHLITLAIDSINDLRYDDTDYRTTDVTVFVDYFDAYIDSNFDLQSFYNQASILRGLFKQDGIKGIGNYGDSPKVKMDFRRVTIASNDKEKPKILASISMTYQVTVDSVEYKNEQE